MAEGSQTWDGLPGTPIAPQRRVAGVAPRQFQWGPPPADQPENAGPPSAEKTRPQPPSRQADAGRFRTLVDALICLYIAVILFRTFELEGYIISTGSMAPSLLGFHKRVICPSCGYRFAFGIPVDAAGLADDASAEPTPNEPGRLSQKIRRDTPARGDVRCPNCGEDAIDVDKVPANYGDQLLVQKHVYEFRPPRRWEVVVLRSPVRPTPPFVKRIVGLPNESVQIVDGDIYANGKICRKSLDEQRAVRIPVFDNDFVPDRSSPGHGSWSIEPAKVPWQPEGHGFSVSTTSSSAAGHGPREISWLTFHRWIRRGGTYLTEVPLDVPAARVRLPRDSFPQIKVDSERHQLICQGALAGAKRDRLLELNSGEKTVCAAIERLAERSHLGPVTDEYGYNRTDLGLFPLPVRDLMLECRVAFDSDAGELLFEIAGGRGQKVYRLTIDRSRNEARLTTADRAEPLRRTPLGRLGRKEFHTLEFSVFDRQVMAALDKVPLFAAWECDSESSEASRTPIRIGAQGTDGQGVCGMHLAGIKVFRDIYYTRGQGRNGVDQPIRLADDEYFVLGDNSPISNDGRSWIQGGGAVKRSQFIGKPLVVHLPSQPGEFTFGGRTRYIRIPDFSRMRYIR